MRILITTGIYKPELGGPASYVESLANKLVVLGHEVKIVTYSDKSKYDFDEDGNYEVVRIKRSHKLLNYFRYFFVILRNLKYCDFIYATDYVSVGIPVYLATILRRKKYIIRIGGDFIWEKHVNRGNLVTLKDFYDKNKFLNYKNLFNLNKKVLQGANKIIFNSDKIKELFIKYYNLDISRLDVIHNAVPEMQYDFKRDNIKKEIVFFGRFIKVKNIDVIIKSFVKLEDKELRLLLIGDGPERNNLINLIKKLDLESRVEILSAMHGKKLWQRIINCYYTILPSWSDISPNQVYECLQFDVPILLTEENYLPFNTSSLLTIDPGSLEDVVEKMNYLDDSNNYQKFVTVQKQHNLKRNWDDVVEEHLELFEKLV